MIYEIYPNRSSPTTFFYATGPSKVHWTQHFPTTLFQIVANLLVGDPMYQIPGFGTHNYTKQRPLKLTCDKICSCSSKSVLGLTWFLEYLFSISWRISSTFSNESIIVTSILHFRLIVYDSNSNLIWRMTLRYNLKFYYFCCHVSTIIAGIFHLDEGN